MRVAFLSPLPPTRSGVAHYASMLLPELRRHADVTAFGSADGYDADDFDVAIYQLGNNPHHEFVYSVAMRTPGVAVLHDVVLHHLIVEMTLARGDAEGYVAALQASHGQAGAAWARGRTAGLHSEMGNFLFPGSVDLARKSRAVIVHNRWAAERLASFGIETPIHVVPHPYEVEREHHERDAVRAFLGVRPEERVIGLFGFLTSAKRGEIVVKAFQAARARDPRIRLLVVGEPAPDIDVRSIAGEGVTITGYVADEDFGRYYAAADRFVNLRYPSAGETSGTLIRAFVAGKPVAVSDYAQFAEFPDACAVKIPFGDREVDTLAEFFVRDLDESAIAVAQKDWLEENARIEMTVNGYLEAVRPSSGAQPALSAAEGRHLLPAGGEKGVLALFPGLAPEGIVFEESFAVLTLRNDGAFTLPARVYGEPGYRLLAKLFDGPREVADHWLQLTGDLRPGRSADFRIPLTDDALTLRIYHALEGIPIVDATPAAEIEIARV